MADYNFYKDWDDLGVDEKHQGKTVGLFCRAVGCKGTNLDLAPTKEGLMSLFSDAGSSDTGGIITWEELESMLEYAKKKKLYTPK